MRGAGLRLNVDVRRHWRCAACGADRRLPATVTSVKCICTGNPQMQLLEGQRRDRMPTPPPDMVLEFDLSDEPVTIPENLPVPDPNQRMGRPGPRGRRHGGPDLPPPSPQAPSSQAAPGSDDPQEGMSAGAQPDRDSRRGPSQRGGERPPNQEPRSRRSRDRPRRDAAQVPRATTADAVQSAGDTNELTPRHPVAPDPSAQPSVIEDFGAGLENSGA